MFIITDNDYCNRFVDSRSASRSVCSAGDNSILGRATDAKKKTEYGKAQEALSIAYAEAVGGRYLNNSTVALESEVVQKLQNAGYTIGTEASGAMQLELSSTSVTIEEGGNTEEVTATIKASTKYMLVDGLYYSLTITDSTASLGTEGKSELVASSIGLSDLTLNTTGSITASLNSTTGVITITSGSVISDNNKVELVDNDGTNYGTINVVVISVIGDYVNYNVPYTDMYSDTDPNTDGLQGYNFTATDGWRILSRVKNASDSSKYDIKIISTGIPAKLYYHYRNNIGNGNNGWWGTDDQVKNTYMLSSMTGIDVGSRPVYYAVTGLKENFVNIKLSNNLNPLTENEGCYNNIGGVTGEILYGDIFKANEFTNINIHNLTIEELNVARRVNQPKDRTKVSLTSDGDIGLFNLKDIENEIDEISYPYLCYFVSDNIRSYEIVYVNINGKIDDFFGETGTRGLRPVVEIQGVTMTQDPTTKVWTISQ